MIRSLLMLVIGLGCNRSKLRRAAPTLFDSALAQASVDACCLEYDEWIAAQATFPPAEK